MELSSKGMARSCRGQWIDCPQAESWAERIAAAPETRVLRKLFFAKRRMKECRAMLAVLKVRK